MKKIVSQFVKKTQLSPKVWEFEFVSSEDLGFVAGQYIILDCDGKGKRMYSIASSEADQKRFTFILTYYPGGLASEYLMSLKENDDVNMLGPLGKFVLQNSRAKNIFLVTGTGVAPAFSILKSMIDGKIDQDTDLSVFWGMRYQKDLFMIDELEKCKSVLENFDYQIFLSQEEESNLPSTQKLGRFTPYIQEFVNMNRRNIDVYDFYICGNGQVVEETKHLLLDLGVMRSHIYYERFN